MKKILLLFVTLLTFNIGYCQLPQDPDIDYIDTELYDFGCFLATLDSVGNLIGTSHQQCWYYFNKSEEGFVYGNLLLGNQDMRDSTRYLNIYIDSVLNKGTVRQFPNLDSISIDFNGYINPNLTMFGEIKDSSIIVTRPTKVIIKPPLYDQTNPILFEKFHENAFAGCEHLITLYIPIVLQSQWYINKLRYYRWGTNSAINNIPIVWY